MPTQRQPGREDDDAWIEARLIQALAALDAGADLDLQALCADRPQLLPEVAAALGLRHAVPSLQAGAEAAPLLGQLLAGRYRLLQPIGRGAAGDVLRGHDETLRRDVAVKIVHAGLIGGADAAARFRREALALAQQAHANVLRVFDQGTAPDGRLFLVTELLQGHSLQAILAAAQQAMPDGPSAASFQRAPWLEQLLPDAALEGSYLRQIVRWTAQLGDGLAQAHAAGVVHRDVKPSNAFVRRDGSAVLLDFGIAARAGDPAVTLEHAIVGTPCYMAPEQAAGRAEPQPAIDVYGLCATLYHLLTLRPPHTGDFATVLHAVRTEDPVPAGWLHNGLPTDLQAILDKGLEREPRRRYADMQALVADLRAFLDHRPVSARPLSGLQRTLRKVRRHPARAVAVGVGVAFVATLAIAVPAWAALSTSATLRERAEGLATLAGDLSIEGWPDQRLLVPLTERQAVLQKLDRLLELDDSDLPTRLLRAAERLDAGDTAGAHADMAAIAAAAPSPYLQAVAARFAEGDGRRGLEAVALDGLPAPTTPADCFVAGFQALRARDCDRADELLGGAGDYLPARDLRLLAMLGKSKRDPERVLAEVDALERIYGRQTARTLHARAAALLLQGRYEAAIPVCEASLRLRPDRHGPMNNLGFALLRLGRPEAARPWLEQAVAKRPWFPNSLSSLSQTLRALGDWQGARDTAARIEDAGWRDYELGCIDLAEAWAASIAEDAERVRSAAAAAVQHFTAAGAARDSRNPKAASVPKMIANARALTDGEPTAALLGFLEQIRSEPRNPQHLASLAGLLRGQEIDDATRDLLRLFLLDLALDLAPDDARLRAGRDALRAEIRRANDK